MITDEYIIKMFYPNNKNFSKKNLLNLNTNSDIYQYLINRYNDSSCIEETIKRIKMNIDIHPCCIYCGKPLKYIGKPSEMFQEKYCSQECLHNDKNHWILCENICEERYGNKHYRNIKKIKETKIKLYNNENYNNIESSRITRLNKYGQWNSYKNIEILKNRSDEIKFLQIQKAKQTKLERYGDENYCNVDKIKQTKLERYGDENYCNVDKIKQTKLERYNNSGYTNREKINETCLNKYGGNSPMCDKKIQNKAKETCFNHYGTYFYINLPDIKRNAVLLSQTQEAKNKSKETKIKKYNDQYYNNREKAKKTCLERYGVSNKRKLQESKKHMSIIMSSKEVQDKRNNTLKENNSFNKSKTEDMCYNLLKEKYPDIIRQYKSKEYPFVCDFYIPSINTYIEFQGSHYHHFHPFNSNNKNDIDELNILKSKSKKNKDQYYYIIYTWTDLDVRKRNIAKQNNLNFIEFWNITEVKEWIDKIK